MRRVFDSSNENKGRESTLKRAEKAAALPFFGKKEPGAGADSNSRLPEPELAPNLEFRLFWEFFSSQLGAGSFGSFES